MINYEQRYVAFLDVLGFKDLVYSNNINKIDLYLNKLEEAIELLKNVPIKGELDFGYIVISDSIIITVKQSHNKDNADNIIILRHLCIAIGFLQSKLAPNDIWLRGGISSGEAYFDKNKNQIIGKAYIDAYLLEDKFASNPQVILDNKIIYELGYESSDDLIDAINQRELGKLSFYNCGETILYEWGNQDHIEKDFPLFIDYLSYYFNPSQSTVLLDSQLDQESIIKNIEKTIYSKTALYSKYKWLANYVLSLIEKKLVNSPFQKRVKRL